MGPRPFFPKGAGFLSCTDTGAGCTFRRHPAKWPLARCSIPRIPGPCRREALLRGVAVCSFTSMTSRDRGLPIGPKEQTAPTLVKAARATGHAFLTFGDDDGYEK